jgi:hypothetical protein
MWVVAAIVSGCQTPYQTMGFTGGVDATPLGNGAYVIHSAVNGYTSQGTAVQYAYRRASELCPHGFRLADSATSSTSSYMPNGFGGIQQVNKPEVSIVVQCNAALTPPNRDAVNERAWWCTDVEGTDVGGCYRTRARCEENRDNLGSGEFTFSPCREQDVAACFKWERVPDDDAGVVTSCHPSFGACRSHRDFVAANNKLPARVLEDCQRSR